MVQVIFSADGNIPNVGLSLAEPNAGRRTIDLSSLPSELTAAVVDEFGVYVTSVNKKNR